jgi:hypothetical protein
VSIQKPAILQIEITKSLSCTLRFGGQENDIVIIFQIPFLFTKYGQPSRCFHAAPLSLYPYPIL